jgi:hypothetical protein
MMVTMTNVWQILADDFMGRLIARSGDPLSSLYGYLSNCEP